MRGRDEPHIGETVLDIAEAAEAFVLENFEEFRLDLQIDVADLVEKQRSSVREIEEPLLRRDRAGERAALVAEQLRLQKILRQPRAIQIDERLLPPPAVAVQPVRENPFARSGLALDQDRPVGGDDSCSTSDSSWLERRRWCR